VEALDEVHFILDLLMFKNLINESTRLGAYARYNNSEPAVQFPKDC
jgi:hypothetical protein